MPQVLGLIVGALALVGAGVGFGYWFATNGRERSKAEAIQAEFDAYRKEVGSHFEQTAQHFQTIGREYRALYDHMASGAEQLCDTRATDERLSFDPRPGPSPSSEESNGAEVAAGDTGAVDSTESAAEAVEDRSEDDRRSAEAAAGLANEANEKTAAPEGSDKDDRRKTEDVADAADGAIDETADVSTPESRVRNAGGESAPAEGADPAPDEASVTGEKLADSSSADSESDGEQTSDDQQVPGVTDARSKEGEPGDSERTYH